MAIRDNQTFQQDDMNRQEESKLYGVFIDQSHKYLNNEIVAMKALFNVMYFFKIFVLPRLNQDPRTTQKKNSVKQEQLSYTLSSVLPGDNAHDIQLLSLAAALERHPRKTGATETPPMGFEKENPKTTETLKSFSLGPLKYWACRIVLRTEKWNGWMRRKCYGWRKLEHKAMTFFFSFFGEGFDYRARL